MKVVLLQNVKKLGKAGEIVNVADGYASNMLFPRKLAQAATSDAIKRVEKNQADAKQKEKDEREKFFKLAGEIKDKKIIIAAKAKGGKLFGSIDAAKIADEIKKQLSIEIPKDFIKMDKPIKEAGEFKLALEFSKDIKSNISIEIKEEK